MNKISEGIITHLQFSKIGRGRVGCRVEPSEGAGNHAWVSIVSKRNFNVIDEAVRDTLFNYEVEFIELSENYSGELDELDYDSLLVKTENFYNLKDISDVERIIGRWVDDFAAIEPIGNVGWPRY